MIRRLLGAVSVLALLPATASAVEIMNPYGVGAWAQMNEGYYSGNSTLSEESCFGNNAPPTYNSVCPGGGMIEGPGTSASVRIDHDVLVPAGEDTFILTPTHAFGSVDLATGEMKVGQYTVQHGNAQVSFVDTILLDPGTFGGDSIDLTFRIALEGTYRAAQVGYLFEATTAGPSGAEELYTSLDYISDDFDDVSSPDFYRINSRGGDWSTFGPNVFEGQLTVLAAHPTIHLRSVLGSSGVFSDFGNTAKLDLSLPTGVTYTSASGVFLTQASGAVPEPSTWAMMLVGFGAVGYAMRRRPARRRQVV